jgi:uncharacterized protein (DUF697 family)
LPYDEEASMANDQHREEPRALRIVKKLADYGIEGVGPLSSAADLAAEYRIDQSYESADERVDGLIRWETAKNFTSGFISGLGGVITLPVAIPAGLGASWIIQARMCASIAAIYGHDTKADRVRTMVLLALLGDAGKEILKQVGVRIGAKTTSAVIARIPGRLLIEINKRIGFRLLTKAGERGAINLVKFVPGIGGLVSGVFDASACVAIGHIAKHSFRPPGGGSDDTAPGRSGGPRAKQSAPRRGPSRRRVASRRETVAVPGAALPAGQTTS